MEQEREQAQAQERALKVRSAFCHWQVHSADCTKLTCQLIQVTGTVVLRSQWQRLGLCV